MIDMSDSQRDKFLAKPRMATFCYVGKNGAPIGVPVWFEWDGRIVRINAGVTSAKIKYLRQDPRISLVLCNFLDEPEGWIAFHGEVCINEKGATELGERLMVRYWPMTGDPVTDARRSAYMEAFRKQEGQMECFVLELTPKRIQCKWEFDDPGDAF
jgi:hypothetical protein